MYNTRVTTAHAFTKQSAAQVLKALNGSHIASASCKPAFILVQQQCTGPRRHFSSTRKTQLKEFFPEPDAPHIKTTEAAWQHPMYTEKQMKDVIVAHRNAKNWSDYCALTAVRILRWGLDIATGYKHDKEMAKGNKDASQSTTPKFAMTERKYMVRNVFLESVAGVPGMVAGMLRHLHSMRRMKRDNGWIETLLEESYNERMHLLTFLKMAEPGMSSNLSL